MTVEQSQNRVAELKAAIAAAQDRNRALEGDIAAAQARDRATEAAVESQRSKAEPDGGAPDALLETAPDDAVHFTGFWKYRRY